MGQRAKGMGREHRAKRIGRSEFGPVFALWASSRAGGTTILQVELRRGKMWNAEKRTEV